MAKKPHNEEDSHKNYLAKSVLNEVGSNLIKDSMKIYGMDVIENRAIPSLVTGLKPVQQRILFSMYDIGLWRNKPYVKCARIVGDVMGRLHP